MDTLLLIFDSHLLNKLSIAILVFIIIFIIDRTKKYWLEKIFFAGWTYIGLMLLFAGGLSKFGHLIFLALCLCMLQNYLTENN